jgi:undecaprenyl-phosphate galactose phosphotransferase/putative colanic acid biosynthesis UDP-glucose lipid carrier transferase
MTISIAPRAAVIALQRAAPWLFWQGRCVVVAVAIVDCILIVAASVAAGTAYHLMAVGDIGDVQKFVGIGASSAVVFALLAKSKGMYRPTTLHLLDQFRGLFAVWMAMLLAVSCLLFLLKLGESFSRGSMVGFGALGFVLLLGSRTVIAKILRDGVAHGKISGPSTIVLGDAWELASYPRSELLRAYGIVEVSRIKLPQGDIGEDSVLEKTMAVLNTAIGAARTYQAEAVLVALKWSDTARYNLIRETLRILPLPVMLLPDQAGRTILSQPMMEVGSGFAVQMQRTPLTFAELVLKRAFDVVAAGGLLLLLSPLLLLVALGIKLDSPGPVIFRQHRNGFNRRPFTIYKFRTMTVCEDGPTIRQAQKNDKRLTRFGALLRSTSIDELPQLVNVLRGEMSLVGPRPHARAHDDEYSKLIAHYAFRHHVKPGITGFAQIKGLRGETARLEHMERRVDCDLWYINNWSIWLDIWILIRTCIVVPLRLNAH